MRENGFFLIKFKEPIDYEKILKNGPMFFNERPIIMRKLSPTIKLDRDLLMSLPIWVIFPSVNL